MKVTKLEVVALSLAFGALGALAGGCSKQQDQNKDAAAPTPAESRGIIPANKARSVAKEASSQVYKGDEGGK